MAAFQHLFAVVDPTQEAQPALERAVTIASERDSYVHAFLCNYQTDKGMADASSRSEAKQETQQRSDEQLRQCIAALGEQSCTIGKEAYWNQNWPKSVVLASSRRGADLVVKTLSPLRTKKLRFKSADRYLLRNNSCPVLLTLPECSGNYRKILLAVDLESTDDAHMRLNNSVISAARQLAATTGAELYLVAAYVDKLNSELLEEGGDAALQERVANSFGIPLDNITLQQGAAKDVILTTADSIDADVLVIGTSARKGLAGALIGNTAEKVLAEISCDVLAVN